MVFHPDLRIGNSLDFLSVKNVFNKVLLVACLVANLFLTDTELFCLFKSLNLKKQSINTRNNV